ncbi:hypothetical protein [Falsiroseomonas sp. CW058]|uniref:hypothetical protein n=1 Tax=Falsiroseomonas sp. CW058 TaxID=3388664 RepID=UPI003D3187C7
MGHMVLAMVVVVLLLAGATGLEALGLGQSLWLTAVVGGLGGLGGGVVLELLSEAAKG